jgi:hypothetical protein
MTDSPTASRAVEAVVAVVLHRAEVRGVAVQRLPAHAPLPARHPPGVRRAEPRAAHPVQPRHSRRVRQEPAEHLAMGGRVTDHSCEHVPMEVGGHLKLNDSTAHG